MLKYKRVAITVKSDFPGKGAAVKNVMKLIRDCGAEALPDATDNIDLLLVLGGDGTILRAMRELKDFSIPILSVNRGDVGFMAEMDMGEAAAMIPRFLEGKGVIEERSVLHVCAERGKKKIYEGCVLNEAVISQGSIARLMDLRTMVNGEELTTFRADGLILATPTGSTAYTLAAGGPIVHPSLSAVILTPINPHSFSQKPIVIPGNHTVQVDVAAKANKFSDVEVSLTLDGQTYVTLQRGDRITASIHTETVKFLRRDKETFYGTLRKKLKWGERPED